MSVGKMSMSGTRTFWKAAIHALVVVSDCILLVGLFCTFLWLLGSPHRELETGITFAAMLRMVVIVGHRMEDEHER